MRGPAVTASSPFLGRVTATRVPSTSRKADRRRKDTPNLTAVGPPSHSHLILLPIQCAENLGSHPPQTCTWR